MNAFAQGLNTTINSGGGSNGAMNEYQQARIKQQQDTTDASVQASQASTDYSKSRTLGQDLKNQQLEEEQKYNAGEMQAAATGGVAAAIDFANKSGKFDRAVQIQLQQNSLNKSLAEGTKATAQSEEEQLNLYATRQKALGGLGALFFKDSQSNANPNKIYQEKYYPAIKQILPNAPKEYGAEAENMLKIAVGQSLQQNSNYSRDTAAAKTLSAYRAARDAGDTSGANFFLGQLQKMSMVVNQQTGEVYNFLGSAPDTNPGSVDTKANANGLGAGSTNAPHPDAVFVQQPMNNTMDTRYQQYDKDNGISPQDRVIKNMKNAQGYNMITKPDGTVEMQKIVGGPADKPITSPQLATLTSALQRGQKNVNLLFDMLVDSKGELKPEANSIVWQGQALNAAQGSPWAIRTAATAVASQKSQLFQTYAASAIEGIMRGFTGATINESERPRLESELIPQAGDKPETIKAKLEVTHEILNGSLNIMKYGLEKGTAKTTADGTLQQRQVDYKLLHSAVDYASRGGDILDITKGNGADPEKARLNQLKELSYNPQQVQMLMSGQYNGQGKDLSKQDAQALIDAANKAGKILPGDPRMKQQGQAPQQSQPMQGGPQ